MTQIKISATLLRAAATCVSKELTRYYLQGVHVVPAPDPETGLGVLMVATDGHRLALVWDENGFTDSEHLIQTDWHAKGLKKAKREDDRVLQVHNDLRDGSTVSAEIRLGYGPNDPLKDAVLVRQIDGTFPDWTRILPKGSACDGGIPAGQFFNATYLKGFEDAFDLAGVGSTLSVCAPTPGSPAWVWNADTPYMAFICMPVRCATDYRRPWFIDYAIGGDES